MEASKALALIIRKIKANLSVYTKKKTSNIFEGAYNSVYKGKSMNFEDLREYVIGDNVKDIDWKASARSNKILIKQYIAEKKLLRHIKVPSKF